MVHLQRVALHMVRASTPAVFCQRLDVALFFMAFPWAYFCLVGVTMWHHFHQLPQSRITKRQTRRASFLYVCTVGTWYCLHTAMSVGKRKEHDSFHTGIFMWKFELSVNLLFVFISKFFYWITTDHMHQFPSFPFRLPPRSIENRSLNHIQQCLEKCWGVSLRPFVEWAKLWFSCDHLCFILIIIRFFLPFCTPDLCIALKSRKNFYCHASTFKVGICTLIALLLLHSC